MLIGRYSVPLPQSVGPTQQFWRNQHGPSRAVKAVFVHRAGGRLLAAGKLNCYRGSNAPYDANRLYVKAFLWTEADDNIDLNNIKVAVNGTAVPEPSEPSYAWKQLVERHHLC